MEVSGHMSSCQDVWLCCVFGCRRENSTQPWRWLLALSPACHLTLLGPSFGICGPQSLSLSVFFRMPSGFQISNGEGVLGTPVPCRAEGIIDGEEAIHCFSLSELCFPSCPLISVINTSIPKGDSWLKQVISFIFLN